MLASLRQTSPSFMELRPLPNTYTSPWTYGQDLPRVCSRLSWSPSSVLPTHELPPSCSREVPGGSVISGRVAPHKSGAHSWETSKVGSTLVGDRPGTTSRDHTRGRQAKSGAISQDLVWTPGAAPKPPRVVVVDNGRPRTKGPTSMRPRITPSDTLQAGDVFRCDVHHYLTRWSGSRGRNQPKPKI